MRLSHLHLSGPITYSHSLRLQEALLQKQFAHKSSLRTSKSSLPSSLTPSSTPRPPNPTLLTFQSQPVYTVGRRHLNANPLSPAQIAYLTTNINTNNDDPRSSPSSLGSVQLATFYPSPRGGLLTYHAPGQVTAYLILNLRTHNLTPRCYIRALENTVIRTCARHGVPNTGTTADPGVWITDRPNWEVISGSSPHSSSSSSSSSCQAAAPPPALQHGGIPEPRGQDTETTQALQPTNRKICAVGVQVSRGITSHGIGLNVLDSPIVPAENGEAPSANHYTLPDVAAKEPSPEADAVYTRLTTQLDHYNGNNNQSSLSSPSPHRQGSTLAPGYLSWGFSRIVACGLEGKSVSWLSREQQQASLPGTQPLPPTIDGVSQSLAIEVCRSLGLDERDIEPLTEDEVLIGEAAHAS